MFSLAFLSFFVFCISYRLCCIFLPVREPDCSSSPSPTLQLLSNWTQSGRKWRWRKKKEVFKQKQRRACVLLTTFVYRRPPPHRPEWSGARADHTSNSRWGGRRFNKSFLFIVGFFFHNSLLFSSSYFPFCNYLFLLPGKVYEDTLKRIQSNVHQE